MKILLLILAITTSGIELSAQNFCSELIKNGIFENVSFSKDMGHSKFLMERFFSSSYSTYEKDPNTRIKIGYNSTTKAGKLGFSKDGSERDKLEQQILDESIFDERTWFKLDFSARKVSKELIGILNECVKKESNINKLVAWVKFNPNDPNQFSLHFKYRADAKHPDKIPLKITVMEGDSLVKWEGGNPIPEEVYDDIPLSISGIRTVNKPIRILIDSGANVTPVERELRVPALKKKAVWLGKVRFESNFRTSPYDVDLRKEDLSKYTEGCITKTQYDCKTFRLFQNNSVPLAFFGYVSKFGQIEVHAVTTKKPGRGGPTYNAGEKICAISDGSWTTGIKILEFIDQLVYENKPTPTPPAKNHCDQLNK